MRTLLLVLVVAAATAVSAPAVAAEPPPRPAVEFANDEPGGGGCNPYPVQSCWAIPIGNGEIRWLCNTWWIWPC